MDDEELFGIEEGFDAGEWNNIPVPKRHRRVVCEGCGQNAVEEKGDLCPGCDAYREHQR